MTVVTLGRRERLAATLLVSLLSHWPQPPLHERAPIADASASASAAIFPSNRQQPIPMSASPAVQKALQEKGFPTDAIVVPVLWRARPNVPGDFEPLKYLDDALAEDWRDQSHMEGIGSGFTTGGPFNPRARLTPHIVARRSHLLALAERRLWPGGEEADQERRDEALASAQRHDRHSAELASQVEISIPQSK